MARSRHAVLLATLGLMLAGCQNMNNTQSGALLGTGLGATAGALIGNASGHAGGGALIGAAAGAVTGGLAGNAADAREERDAAVAHAQYANAKSQAFARAVTASDVVTMAHSGVGDDVIVNALRTRGCRWDSSPDAVIALKQQGVSDRVIEAMQNTGLRPISTDMAPPPPVVYGPPPPVAGGVVVVGPGYYGPRPDWGPRPYYYGRPYYRRW